MLKLSALIVELQWMLSKKYGEREAGNLTYLIIYNSLGYSRKDCEENGEEKIEEEDVMDYHRIVYRLIDDEPIQYIYGRADFYGLTFQVNEYTFIPRPETEELVQWVLDIKASKEENKGKELKCIDIATGSGCIAITLKHNMPKSEWTAIEVSEMAIETAVQNALDNKVKVKFIVDNITYLEQDKEYDQYDLIVSNPPYIPLSEVDDLPKNIVDWEPPGALFVHSPDPLSFYDHIGDFALKYLKADGDIFVEIHEKKADEVMALFQKKGFVNCILREDLQGKDRMVKASRN